MNKRKCGIALTLLVFMLAVVLAMAHTENAEAATLRLNKTRVTLAKGGQAKLKVVGAAKKIKWTTSSKKVAIVTKKGVVKAKGKGTARITAKVRKKKLTCKVTVEAPKLNHTRLTVSVGGKATLKLNGTKGKVKWLTSDKRIATVTQKGVVRGVRAGGCRIYAKARGKMFVCVVNVSNAVVRPSNPTVIPTPNPTPGSDFNENDAKNSIAYTSHRTELGVVLIVKNNYRYAVRLEAQFLFYNSGGTMVGTRSDDCYVLESGREAALHVRDPYDSNYNAIAYSRYTINIKCAKPYYPGNANNISCTGNFGSGNVVATVKNNGQKVMFTRVAIVYYKNGNVIGYDYHYAEVNNPGSTDYLQFSYPYDSDYNTIVPDNFKLFVNYSY